MLQVLLVSFMFMSKMSTAQLSYDASIAFALNKINTTYTGNVVQVRRACDNQTVHIGFNSCGNLDTIALNSFAGLQNFPLGSITATTTAAYSLRKINCAYNGFAIRVRSSAAGSPTANIGFSANGDLDTVALKTFVGTNSAFVTTWYDQSGNARDVSQATNASQPRIVNAGVIARQNNKPALNFVGGNHTLFLNTLMMTDKISVSVVAKINNAGGRYALFDLGSTAGSYPDFVIESNTYSTAGNKWGFYTNNNSLDGTVSTSTGLTALSILAQNTYTTLNVVPNSSLFVNGAASPLSCRSCVTNTYRTSWPNGFVIGNFNTYPAGLDGFISEMIVFPSVLSTIEREFLEWSQAQYYSITTGISAGTRPAGTLPQAYVTTWYDQSGNGRNVSQSTNAFQPRIVNGGVVEKLNTIPAIYFNGTNNLLSASDAGLPTGDLFVSAVVRSNATTLPSGNYACFLHYGTSGSGNAVFGTYGTDGNLGTNAIAVSQYGDGFGVSNSLSSNIIYSTGRASSNYFLYTNGTNASSKTMGTNTTLYGAGGLTIGSTNPSLPGSFLNGPISEITAYPLSFSATRRMLMETNRSAQSGIAVSNSKYAPPSATSYNSFVNGIGRQSATDTVLGTRNTVGMGFNSGLTGSDFLKSDGDYLTAGINCPMGPGTSLLNLPATIVQRWSTDWYLNKIDVGTTGGNLTVFFDFSDYGITGSVTPSIAANYELLYRSSTSSNFTIVTGTSKTIIGDRVAFSLDASALTNNYYYTIGTKNVSASVLPVELISFTAIKNSDKVDIDWITASEKNSDFFTLEKSRDGQLFKTFKITSTKAPKGNSAVKLNYHEVDDFPYDGISYYRLKETDIDGSPVYSKVQYVDFGIPGAGKIEVYPNPNTGHFFVEITNGGHKTLKLTILDVLGHSVYEHSFVPGSDAVLIPVFILTQQRKGIYLLRGVSEGFSFTRKIVVE